MKLETDSSNKNLVAFKINSSFVN